MAESSSLAVALPQLDLPALAVGVGKAVVVRPTGEIEDLSLRDAALVADSGQLLVAHAPLTARRLGVTALRAFDVLELFAFVRPAQFCLPSAAGLARLFGLDEPRDLADEAMVLPEVAMALLRELRQARDGAEAARIAFTMGRGGWAWAPLVLAALGRADGGEGRGSGLDVWNRLPEWEEPAPPPPPLGLPVSAEEARAALAAIKGPDAEERPAQGDYAATVAEAFGLRDMAGMPRVVLAEAGTGIGKTLGYIAPAAVWARKNKAAVWLSTYTKNLQRQLDRELSRLYPDPAEKARRAVIRKGRENYLCLLNLEEVAGPGGVAPGASAIAIGLVVRWARHSRDGDMVGGDFPTWAIELLAGARLGALTDRRGECIHSACPHFRKCFIERARARAKTAEIVVANHALVMIQAALAGEARDLPSRYVFDEGHQVFDAADSAFSARLTGAETAELRRWLRGAEAGHRRAGRGRGLERRIGDLIAGDEAAETALQAVRRAAASLPGEGWTARIAGGSAAGPVEAFLAEARRFVTARAIDQRGGFALEAPAIEPAPDLLEAARTVDGVLRSLAEPAAALKARLAERLDKDAEDLDTPTRQRLEAGIRSLDRRLSQPVTAWRAMLRTLETVADGPEPVPAPFVDWLAIERDRGREVDVGLHRHWLDPTVPLTGALLERAHGVLVTSATLRDSNPQLADDWQAAEARTGAGHLILPAKRASFASPFDYAEQSRVLIVNDVRRDEADEVAAAYRSLFLAARGGGLGLFTAVERLRRVHARIERPLDAAGIRLYAQHVDPMDVGTLVDLFRAEENACLLGTDAVRDGVDVPGRALRLIVFDRVPWPRPSLLHRARREAFGGAAYDDMLVRFRLRQAFGRLIRQAGDRGVFVLLDAMTPTRLLPAFPPGVTVGRVGLAEAVTTVRAFLAE
ncbi:ATP-dependent DNA helicase [Zavarzinia compransoris]|uniref:ATP-dependent DNA helicase n=1 Tax=Zavarzinia compransoris TaxID=1264899 RepID=A0A317DSV4_9PROT|nr:ATP-dependent DNA helicase [Zavarzinia compransoris]PWR17751.1 ATP-dependent DNA helicase [Zavarzinia compransoris]